MFGRKNGSTAINMTSGPIARQILSFALPLMVGNLFQLAYNTVDSIVVGNYVGSQALAAVGATTMIVNILVFFFNGFSVGAGVVIGQYFGARDLRKLHDAVETTITATLILCVAFTIVGCLGVRPMLLFMATPEDVMEEATIYLTIYMAGISGLLIYNMGSGILRAVGDTTRPLWFLILTSIVNIVLDLVFVLVFHMGIAGVAWATIISQMISAVLIMILMTRSQDIYALDWHDLHIDRPILLRIIQVGLPAAIQSVITSFSNVFVQSYINAFGSACMAGWACYNKLDQFAMLSIQSTAMAATTFVSQNIGAGQEKRANRGTVTAILIAAVWVTAVAALLVIFCDEIVGLFTQERAVMDFGILFVTANSFFLIANSVNHTLAGALRGRGDSRGPMFIMLANFVAVRQVYLFLVTHLGGNTPLMVGLGYPVGWVCCCLVELTYYFLRWHRPGGSVRAA